MTPATPSQAAAAVVQQADTIATAQAEAIRRAWEYNKMIRRQLSTRVDRITARIDAEKSAMVAMLVRLSRSGRLPPAEDPADTRMADAFREPEC